MDTSGYVTGEFSGGGRARDRVRSANREFQRISRADQSSMVLGIRDSRFADRHRERILNPFLEERRWMNTFGNVTGDFSGGGWGGIGLRITNREFQRISRTDQPSMV